MTFPKIPPVALTIIFAGIAVIVSRAVPILEFGEYVDWFFALPFLSVGLVLIGWAVMQFRASETSVDPMSPAKATTLVVRGFYRITRNPMYLGMAVVLIALAVYLSNLSAFLGVIGFVFWMSKFQIPFEETALEEAFGEEYLAYKIRVRRWC